MVTGVQTCALRSLYRTTHNSFYLFVVELRHQAEAEYYRHYLIEISFVTHNIDNKLIVGNAYTTQNTVFRETYTTMSIRIFTPTDTAYFR